MHHEFERALRRLGIARAAYEQLRVSDGAFADRADALSELHALRADMYLQRQGLL